MFNFLILSYFLRETISRQTICHTLDGALYKVNWGLPVVNPQLMPQSTMSSIADVAAFVDPPLERFSLSVLHKYTILRKNLTGQ